MKNPYYYLFYRFNQFLNKKRDNELGPVFGLSLLVAWNLVFIYSKLLPIAKENFDGFYKYLFVLLLISIYVINTLLFYNKRRVNKIIEYYEKESKESKRTRGWLIVFYILFSFGLIFVR